MTSEYSADFACGQIFYCLRNSQLNYIVNETPYSAYITIRKKFIKHCVDAPENKTNVRKGISETETNLKKRILS